MREYSSALRWQVQQWIDRVGKVDILVGIPCFNNEETIAHVVSMAGEGLKRYYGGARTAVFISDGGSLDDTREHAYEAPIPKGIERRVAIYRGRPGKGTSYKAIFEVTMALGAEVCITLDSDLRSITPQWIKQFADPVLEGNADFVTPYYRRHKYDGTITNSIAYPLTSALYGKRVRQPIGGDFAFSGELARRFAEADVWDTDVHAFGIDIWMTTTALAEEYRVIQANLGTKVHDAKNPAKDLGIMFRQVLSTLFYLAGHYREKWFNIERSIPIEVTGTPEEAMEIEPVEVDTRKLREEYLDGFVQFEPLYQQLLLEENFKELKWSVGSLRENGRFSLSPELWARVVYDFAFIYQTWPRNRRRLIDIFVPLYFGRTGAYCEEVRDLGWEEAEETIERQVDVFVNLKPYLKRSFQEWRD
jgi:hypothetical protein